MKVNKADLEHLINGLTYVYHTIKNDPDLESRVNGFTIAHIIEARDFLEEMWQEFIRRSTAPGFDADTMSFGEQYGTVEFACKPE